jgi:DNA invertase Pin-like site-specific DNA recombinase
MRKNKAVIFARVSSSTQSFDRQVRDLEKVAEHKQLKVIHVITEKISGGKRNDEREGVQKLLEVIKQGKADWVLVSEVSRLGRSTMETLRLVEDIHNARVNIHLADLGMDTLGKDGKPNLHAEIVLHMLALFAKDWRRTHSERVKSGQSKAMEAGVKFGRPKGVESIDQFLSKHPEIVRSFMSEKLSVRKRALLYGVSPNTVIKVKKALHSR